jgi:hypothetical protein
MTAADLLAIFTLLVLVVQTIILYRQTMIEKVQSKIQETELELSETVTLSGQPYFDQRPDRLKVNFKNEGKGSADSTKVWYALKKKGSENYLIGLATLQALGPGSTAEIEITSDGIQMLLGKYEKLLLSWQGTRTDGKSFNGSLGEVQLGQLTTVNRF